MLNISETVLLTGTHTYLDLEWLSEIFNDTKHRAISLRQLSFLFGVGLQVQRVLCCAAVWVFNSTQSN